jgi:hypothetical protein
MILYKNELALMEINKINEDHAGSEMENHLIN